MVRFNSDIVFIDTSGQVRAIKGDLTLRANESGGGHIIIGSGESLRPENNCDASDAIDLGIETHRWKTLFACSGNFLDRPTVNGSGVLLQGDTVPASVAAGVDTINGLSGVVTLVSVNDAITITENGQTIEFSGIFTQASGTLLETVGDLVGSGVVNQLNGLSGIVDIVGVSGINVFTSGNSIVVDLDGSGLLVAIQEAGFSGLFGAVTAVEVTDQSTNALVPAYDTLLTLSGIIETPGVFRIGWSIEGEVDSDGKKAAYRVQLNDTDNLMEILPSFSEEASPSIFSGFAYRQLGSGVNFIDFDFAVADTGVFNTVRFARLEMWKFSTL